MASKNLAQLYNEEILLLGYHAWGNIGDDAILVSLINILDRLFNSNLLVDIYLRNNYMLKNFENPKKISIRFITSFKDLFCTLVRVRKIIIDGGDHLHDYCSLRKLFKTFIILFALAILARVTFKDLLLINNGFRAKTVLGAVLIKCVLVFTKCISTRDKFSYALLSRLISKPVIQGFDTAIELHEQFRNNSSVFVNNTPNKIGISLTPVFMNFFSAPSKDDLLAEALASNIRKIFEKFKNVELYLLAFDNNPKKGDLIIIKKIIRRLPHTLRGKIKVISYNGNIKDFLSNFSQLDIIICCKYHSVIFSYLLSKPMLVINYQPKNAALVKEIMLPNKAMVSLEEIMKTNDVLASMLLQLLKNPSSHCAKLPISEAIRRAFNGVQKCLK
ncbi:MAG: polysaccharide pyruvyl transferase family protein [Candidatus Omnitrophica bacterium]|nr:polysaccharide pyruvyl transferase family protein [Candidatus Omnitrophota bacterium]